MRQTKTGILLANLGTPDAPTPEAVKRYLNQFLSDRKHSSLITITDAWLIPHGCYGGHCCAA